VKDRAQNHPEAVQEDDRGGQDGHLYQWVPRTRVCVCAQQVWGLCIFLFQIQLKVPMTRMERRMSCQSEYDNNMPVEWSDIKIRLLHPYDPKTVQMT
jgi:hypothetical protein